ncbi:unnamed protein product [Allacma fusca]|uniref:Uncharacterized protein n=1 Tax=Allacma fusca TaxID=39272 RepID=A0A8J2JMJ3_9HEXA|nr:unnamed protein product [Allacma fusca]
MRVKSLGGILFSLTEIQTRIITRLFISPEFEQYFLHFSQKRWHIHLGDQLLRKCLLIAIRRRNLASERA